MINTFTLQQYLPFTVLKLPHLFALWSLHITTVATVLTVYGIETSFMILWVVMYTSVATVLTVYGIETI